jgi:hypothetical protein
LDYGGFTLDKIDRVYVFEMYLVKSFGCELVVCLVCISKAPPHFVVVLFCPYYLRSCLVLCGVPCVALLFNMQMLLYLVDVMYSKNCFLYGVLCIL